MWTEPKCPAQPVQQAQTLIKGGTLNSVAAIMVRDDIKPMIALDFIARLGYILPCHDVVHAVGSDYALCGDGSIGQVKHQSTGSGAANWKAQMEFQASSSSVGYPV